jgi:hypothetical protein
MRSKTDQISSSTPGRFALHRQDLPLMRSEISSSVYSLNHGGVCSKKNFWSRIGREGRRSLMSDDRPGGRTKLYPSSTKEMNAMRCLKMSNSG